jgi:hypothetical protein
MVRIFSMCMRILANVFVVFILKFKNFKHFTPYVVIRSLIWCHSKADACSTENPIYVFPEMKQRSLVPNSYISVSVSGLNIPRIGLLIWLQQNWKLGDRSL